VTDELLAEQIRYYRERAPEYDATSPADVHPYADTFARAAADLRVLGPVGLAIELGAGTGQFTGSLARIAETVVAVDASPEALERLQVTVDASNVDTVAADLFAWSAEVPADLVVFGALLSHIPSDRFDAFWSVVDAMLASGGRVFIIDESPHDLWSEEATAQDEVVMRTLEDGRRFRIVKVLWEPDALARRLEASGWQASFVREDPLYWGVVTRR
jgi:demethylmenaquinone methyltransferase/2-methoxy-6-polyprenyl-1,4-benzoquinol methylase